MSETVDKSVVPLDQKRGYPVYDRNPSVAHPNAVATRRKPVRIANGNRLMIVGRDTGEILGEGHAAFFEMKEVDETQFVKLYLAGIQQTTKLTAAGLKVFELVFHQMRGNPQSDKIEMNHYLVKKYGLDMTARTYQRGMREMLEHNFLFRSTSDDVYFVNINFVFNGNRITLAKSYYLKGTGAQLGLDLDPPALPAPEKGD
jgi:hypothetical protein